MNEERRSTPTRFSLATLGVCAALALQGCGTFETETVYVRNELPERISLSGDCTADAIFLEQGELGLAETYPHSWTACGVDDSSGNYLGCIITPTHGKSDPLVLNKGALVHISDRKCQDWVGPGSP